MAKVACILGVPPGVGSGWRHPVHLPTDFLDCLFWAERALRALRAERATRSALRRARARSLLLGRVADFFVFFNDLEAFF